MSEIELESTYKNQLDRITLSSEQRKELNSILNDKHLSNDFKREAILRFRGSCSVCNNEPSLYALINKNDDQVLERYCPECFDRKYPV